MARIFKRTGSDFYYGRFKIDGKEHWFSTKTTDRKKAQEIIDAKIKVIRGTVSTDDYFNGLLILLARIPKADQDIKRNEYARRLMQGQSSTLPISSAWKVWLDSPLKGNPSEKTITGYIAVWKRFLGWITGHKISHVKNVVKFLHEITEAQAQDYVADLWKSGVSPRTFNGHAKFLKSMFRVLRVKAGLLQNVWDNIKTMDKETQSRLNFTPEELAVICAKASGSFRYMIGIGLYSGMRLGDVVNLRWENIGKDSIKIIPSKTRRKGKHISLPIHPILRALLKELKTKAADSEPARNASHSDTGGYLFPTEREAYIKDAAAITKRFQQFLNDCGIKTTEEGNGHRRKAIVRKGFHSLRHSFVSLCAANRVPQVAIMDLVGHGSPAMTELYSHADFEQKQNAIKSLPDMVFTIKK